jgi:hypothetical protein
VIVCVRRARKRGADPAQQVGLSDREWRLGVPQNVRTRLQPGRPAVSRPQARQYFWQDILDMLSQTTSASFRSGSGYVIASEKVVPESPKDLPDTIRRRPSVIGRNK